MKGVPPEIDDLMWRLAEDGSSAARKEFESRHTRYAPELARRTQMVAELRQAGRSAAHRPTFNPRPSRVTKTPIRAVAAVVCLVTIAVGAVTYVAASGGEKPVVANETPQGRTLPPPVVVPPVVVYSPPPRQDPPANPSKPPETIEPERTPDYRKPRDVRIAETSLTSAINLVASGTGLNVTIAPGFSDRQVSLDYVGLSPVDILKAMGEQYGFSVLEEEEGRILLVPARDPGSSVRSVGP